MLKPRLIPCLLIKDGNLVKTVKFGQSKYVGDPLNAVRIFNEKQVDEIMVIDIDATVQGKEPDYDLISHLASECRMPLCYGGGVTSALQIEKIIGLALEKVALSAAAIQNPQLIQKGGERVGGQSMVVVLDVKKKRFFKGYDVYIHNGTKNTGRSLPKLIHEFEKRGVGEIVINAIDEDGVMKGYDIDLAASVQNETHVPITFLGGAGSLQDVQKLIRQCGIVGAAAGSLFVFKGKYKAVLINYPSPKEKKEIFDILQ